MILAQAKKRITELLSLAIRPSALEGGGGRGRNKGAGRKNRRRGEGGREERRER